MQPSTPSAGSPMPTNADIDAACGALQELKRQLQKLVHTGGGELGMGLLTATADDCPDAVIICTDSAEIRVVNSAAARLTGMSTRELQTLTVWDLTHAESQVDFEVLWREFLRAGRQRGIYTLRNREGGAVHLAYCAEVRVLANFHIALLRTPAPRTEG